MAFWLRLLWGVENEPSKREGKDLEKESENQVANLRCTTAEKERTAPTPPQPTQEMHTKDSCLHGQGRARKNRDLVRNFKVRTIRLAK